MWQGQELQYLGHAHSNTEGHHYLLAGVRKERFTATHRLRLHPVKVIMVSPPPGLGDGRRYYYRGHRAVTVDSGLYTHTITATHSQQTHCATRQHTGVDATSVLPGTDSRQHC
ncbi:hypothetical protein E2C01_064652 [Portunus trituberculatus]|uniref:Uncharacterized protein n=1 Tax=Portunus trituberculatus TaxID=210409 RepID=A0A5B7HJQ0_PORTR|nr:hypothetical protein [Portunus trituberculatus]